MVKLRPQMVVNMAVLWPICAQRPT